MKELGIAQDAGKVSFGQLYGMCDQVSFLLGKVYTALNNNYLIFDCVTGDDICHVRKWQSNFLTVSTLPVAMTNHQLNWEI